MNKKTQIKIIKILIRKWGKIAALIAFALLVIAYILIGLSYSDRLLPNTYVNGMDFSGKGISEIDEYYLQMQNDASISITTKEGTDDYPLTEVADYRVTADTSTIPSGFLHGIQWLWSAMVGTDYEIEVTTLFDVQAIEKMTDRLASQPKEVVAPQDAYMERGEDGVYVIVPEVAGNTMIRNKASEAIRDAVAGEKESVDLCEAGCYELPEILSTNEELNYKVSLYNGINGETVTIDFVDATETLTADDIVKHVRIGEDGIVLVSDRWLDEKMDEFSEKYNTFGTTRQFTTTGGQEITVGGTSYDTYGFRLDKAKTRQALQDAIKGKEDTVIKAVWDLPGIRRASDDVKDDLGGTYIEISISAQHLWYYEAGELKLECDVVTGDANKGRDTPKGLCRIWSKETDRYLRGDSWNTHVNYWMPFNWVNCGLHDATWRSSFGGSIYKGNGSHGCVNMPYQKAASLYKMVAYDTPVVLY